MTGAQSLSPAFSRNPHQTLEESTYRYLREAIATGELAPGTKLVGSRLAEQLYVSRITIANALKRLASEGFVVGVPHKEAIVASLDESRLHEIFLMRHALEAIVMHEASHKITAATLARLRGIDEQIRQCIEQQDTTRYRQLEREYHLMIYAAADLPMITALLCDLWDRLEPYRGRRYSNLRLRSNAYTEHHAILAALEARDGDAAVAGMRLHVDHGYDRFRQTLEGAQEIADEEHGSASKRQEPRSEPLPGSLRAALMDLPDRRRKQGKIHRQGDLLALSVCAMLTGVRSRYGIAQWAQSTHPSIRTALGFRPDVGPSISTIHRLFQELDQDAFRSALQSWLLSRHIPETCWQSTAAVADLAGMHGEQLPAVDLLVPLAQALRLALAQEGESQSAIDAATLSALRRLPLQLFAGDAEPAQAVIAAQELSVEIVESAITVG